MPTDFSQFGPFLVAALVVFAIYRRFRRSFGRQLLSPRRMTLRMVLLVVAAGLLLSTTSRSTAFVTAELLGAALGIGLGMWGSRQTRFLMYGGRMYYVPHTYTGVAVSLLFVGRLAFRFVQVTAGAPVAHAAQAGGSSQILAPASMVRSPFTVGVFFVLAGYYLCYYGWVLWKSKHLDPSDLETVTAAAT